MPDDRPATSPSRRDWLRSALGACLIATTGRAEGPTRDDAAEVEALAKKAGLGEFGRTETSHFLGLGDAPSAFRAEALSACEAMSTEFLIHFRDRGFADLAMPKRKLVVVILADSRSYAAYAGVDRNLVIGGHFELDTNRLVMFDFRADQASVNTAAQLVNTFTLIHETTHQLTFNTGLLDLRADVPLCVSEGLATYGEVWRPKGRARVGQVNRPRLIGLPKPRRDGTTWLPLSRLLVEDDLLKAEVTQQAAYAQSWIFIHSHMKSAERLPKLRAYLATIAGRRDKSHRLDDARAHLGDLDKLDVELKRYVTRPIGA